MIIVLKYLLLEDINRLEVAYSIIRVVKVIRINMYIKEGAALCVIHDLILEYGQILIDPFQEQDFLNDLFICWELYIQI